MNQKVVVINFFGFELNHTFYCKELQEFPKKRQLLTKNMKNSE